MYESKINVVVANTFSQEWEIAPYRRMAEKRGAKLKIINMTEEYGSIHGVPQAAIERMKERWEKITK